VRIAHHDAVTIAASPFPSDTAEREVQEARRLAWSALCRAPADAMMGE
jgi:hypothetical protein